MSSRGQRLSGADAVRFSWGSQPVEVRPSLTTSGIWRPAPQDASGPAHVAAWTSPVELGSSLAGAAPPVAAPADQQAHFAALERDAFTKGYAQGERAGLEAGGKRAEAMLRRLAQTLEELSTLRMTMARQTEKQLVQLAVAIARRILQREVAADPELTAALAHIALDRLGPATPAVIRLHPEDYAVVAAQHDGTWAGRQVQVLPDPAVSRGGCLVESEFGYIDASVDAQMNEIAAVVLGDERTQPVAARRGAA